MNTDIFDLGKIGITLGGKYDNRVVYEKLTIVLYKGKSYISTKITQGVSPEQDVETWQLVAEAKDAYHMLVDAGKTTLTEEEFLKQLVDATKGRYVIQGNLVNAADEEDLTVEHSDLLGIDTLKLADRPSTNGMGYVILRKNKTFAEQVTKENTIYEIRYNFDLNGEEVTIPNNCILKFEGGKISNGTINFNKTFLEKNVCILTNVAGTVSNEYVTPNMFGAKGDGISDDSDSIINAINVSNNILLLNDYGISKSIYLHNNIKIDGNKTIIALNRMDKMLYCYSNTELKNITVNGNYLAVGGIEVLSDNTNITIDSVKSINFKTFSDSGDISAICIKVGNRCSNIDIKNCYIANTDPYKDSIVGNGLGSGTGILICQSPINCKIKNCIIENIQSYEDGDGIHIFSMKNTTEYLESDVVIEDCKFYKLYKRAIKLQANDVIVKNCVCIDQRSDEFEGIVECISVYGNNCIIKSNIFKLHKCKYVINVMGNNCIIEDNNFNVNPKYNTLHGGNTNVLVLTGNDSIINNNTFFNGKNNIIYLSANNATITNNKFISSTVNYAIFIISSIENIIIKDNFCKLPSYTYFVYQYNCNTTNLIITNNIIQNFINFLGLIGGTISGIIKDNTVTNIMNKIKLEGTTDISELYIEHNQFNKQSYGTEIPSATNRTLGDIHINSNPNTGNHIGWVLTNTGWSPYGLIE